MPEVTHEIVVRAPLAATWAYVSDMDNWAPLMPGFRGMTATGPRSSEWKIQGDVGILSRLVTLDVAVTDWVEGDRVAFALTCREEPLSAEGSLRAAPAGAESTRLAFRLSAKAGGMLAPAVNALLGKVMPGMASDFASSLAAAIEARERGAASA